MRNSNGVPLDREINVRFANMEFGHDSYTYHEIPVNEDVMKYYTKGIPPGDAV
ncbi:MAG: hypothetical protein JW976_12645 [Syntrophaceae bacterium]|nr:hypothetical protein [Syntrophaceae bacterium]